MTGVKGRSGRKTNFERLAMGRFTEFCTSWLEEHFEEFDLKTKVRIATMIASKAVIQQSNNTVEMNFQVQKDQQERAIADHVRKHINFSQVQPNLPSPLINGTPYAPGD